MNRRSYLFGLMSSGFAASFALGATRETDTPNADGVGQVSTGDYVEVDELGMPNPSFPVRVTQLTPHILEVRGGNGWVAFVCYDDPTRTYHGFFEWQQFGPQRSPGGKWADLYQVKLIRQGDGVLRMTGKSSANEFVIRARAKA